MLLHRYGNIDLLKWEFQKAVKVVSKAYEKESDEKLFLRWIPYQGEYSFEMFKRQLMVVVEDEGKSESAILEDVKEIISKVVK